MQFNLIISLRNEVIELNIFQNWPQSHRFYSSFLSQSRENQQGSGFGLTVPPRLGLKDSDELCTTKNG